MVADQGIWPQVAPMRSLLIAGIMLSLAGCGDRQGPPPEQYKTIRTYGWETTVADPQAEWNPSSYAVLARAAAGFALLEEGGGKQIYYASKEGRTMRDAQWVSPTQFVFGPEKNVVKTNDGAIVPVADGLELVTLAEGSQPKNKTIINAGWRPRPWGKTIICQVSDYIQQVDTTGRMSEWGRGFNAEPQANGPGICWLEKPILEPDYWTVKPGLGQLVIRWNFGQITMVPAGVEARWTANGGVVVTTLRSTPPATGPWWSAGTDLVYYASHAAQPVVIAADAHDPAPHPQLGVVAAAANDGRLLLLDLSGRPQATLAEVGARPRWSADGARLLVEEPLIADAGATKNDAKYVRVYILSTTTIGTP